MVYGINIILLKSCPIQLLTRVHCLMGFIEPYIFVWYY